MALPDPKARPQQRAQQSPKDATGRTPTTGAEPVQGSTRAETQTRGQGFGLSSAGGRGGGVSVDVANFCCPDYLADMIARVTDVWESKQGLTGTTTMRFTILRDGTITAVHVAKPSGFDKLDGPARRALEGLHKFKPLPKEYSNPTLTVDMEFEYSP